MLYGTSDSEPQNDIAVAQLSQELYNSGLLVLLTQNLSRVDFEVSFGEIKKKYCASIITLLFVCSQGKKDVAQIFNNILRRQIGTRSPTVEYICTKPEILFTLVQGYVMPLNFSISL